MRGLAAVCDFNLTCCEFEDDAAVIREPVLPVKGAVDTVDGAITAAVVYPHVWGSEYLIGYVVVGSEVVLGFL